MKIIARNILSLGMVLAFAGCTDLKPVQASLDDLKTQVGRLQSGVASARNAADSAARSANQASQAAAGAQGSANQALSEARSQQAAIQEINEKLDRMFRKSVSK
jgi:uncharacterized phage infection (PIP) family protein YhgE